MAQAQATLHGAISIVNAVATGKGATLGVSLKTSALLETSPGNGVFIESRNKAISSRLINKVIQKVIPKNDLENTKIQISLQSEIPTGYGLKSSSAISSAVALACAKLFRPKWNDSQILLAGVDASIESKVSSDRELQKKNSKIRKRSKKFSGCNFHSKIQEARECKKSKES
jgi:shikimate kinase